MSLTQSKTVPTTGHVHQDARVARGTLTFYNALQQSQYLPSGTLVTSRNGINIVTTQNATIPAGNGITNGSAQVAAHAIDPGAQGNIAAYALDGPCCREYLLVKNLTAFVGGRDARDYQSVTQADIHGAISSLLAPLTQTIKASFAKQVKASETLVQPLCSQAVTANHQVNEEAATVTVTLKKTCLAAAYTTADLQTQVMQVLSHKEPGYRLRAFFQLDPFHASLHQNRLSVSSTYQATFRYQFTQAETTRVLAQIQGKPKQQALQLLTALPGVEHITMTTPATQDTLPTDETYIHLLIEG